MNSANNSQINSLNSPFVIVILSFILTGIVGTFINFVYHSAEWKREKQDRILKYELDESKRLMDGLNYDIRDRWNTTKELIESFGTHNNVQIDNAQQKYNECKSRWILRIFTYRHKILYLFNDEPSLAYGLLDKSNNTNKADSVYRYFNDTDRLLKKFLRERSQNPGFKPENPAYKDLIAEIQKSFDKSGLESSDYIDEVYNAFSEKYGTYSNN